MRDRILMYGEGLWLSLRSLALRFLTPLYYLYLTHFMLLTCNLTVREFTHWWRNWICNLTCNLQGSRDGRGCFWQEVKPMNLMLNVCLRLKGLMDMEVLCGLKILRMLLALVLVLIGWGVTLMFSKKSRGGRSRKVNIPAAILNPYWYDYILLFIFLSFYLLCLHRWILLDPVFSLMCRWNIFIWW